MLLCWWCVCVSVGCGVVVGVWLLVCGCWCVVVFGVRCGVCVVWCGVVCVWCGVCGCWWCVWFGVCECVGCGTAWSPCSCPARLRVLIQNASVCSGKNSLLFSSLPFLFSLFSSLSSLLFSSLLFSSLLFSSLLFSSLLFSSLLFSSLLFPSRQQTLCKTRINQHGVQLRGVIWREIHSTSFSARNVVTHVTILPSSPLPLLHHHHPSPYPKEGPF